MDNLEIATLAAGCFWCIDTIFRKLKGVELVMSGYTGGGLENPTYEAICTGRTGHAEAIQITFNPSIISFKELLDVFWEIHDPTTLNRQGAEIGSQYRSAIFYHSDQQKNIAENSKKEVETLKLFKDPIVTQITQASVFYDAESYHQDFYEKNKSQSYCRLVIDPKVHKFLEQFKDKLK